MMEARNQAKRATDTPDHAVSPGDDKSATTGGNDDAIYGSRPRTSGRAAHHRPASSLEL